MPDQPPSDPSNQPPEPPEGQGQPNPEDQRAGQGSPPTLTPEQAQAILDGAAMHAGPYPMLPGMPFPGMAIPGMMPGMLNPAALLATMQIQQTRIWQGQIPPPDAMAQFEQILPGSFDRILKMAEKQQEGQIRNIEQAQRLAGNDVQRGHYLGFALSALAIISAGWFVHEHSPVIAGLCLGVPVLAVAKALIDSTRPSGGSSSADGAQPPVQPPAANPPNQ